MVVPRIIAIDGPAASGKSTLGKMLADNLGYLYLDTGVMYRAVTWAVLRDALAIQDECAITELAEKINIDILPASKEDGRSYDVWVDGVDITWEIRRPEVEANVSVVSAYPGVRSAMTNQQRRIGLRGNIVMVGRDIGTVVLPEADLKLFLDASVSERARRRYLEAQKQGEGVSIHDVEVSMLKRDEIDSTRAVAPLKPAPDARIIDTDDLTIDQVLDRVKRILEGERD
jgi:cytidylate kinase